jgi:hypothetical protein
LIPDENASSSLLSSSLWLSVLCIHERSRWVNWSVEGGQGKFCSLRYVSWAGIRHKLAGAVKYAWNVHKFFLHPHQAAESRILKIAARFSVTLGEVLTSCAYHCYRTSGKQNFSGTYGTIWMRLISMAGMAARRSTPAITCQNSLLDQFCDYSHFVPVCQMFAYNDNAVIEYSASSQNSYWSIWYLCGNILYCIWKSDCQFNNFNLPILRNEERVWGVMHFTISGVYILPSWPWSQRHILLEPLRSDRKNAKLKSVSVLTAWSPSDQKYPRDREGWFVLIPSQQT